MNVLLWIVQGLLAAAFLASGAMKVSQPKQKLVDMMGWPADFSDNAVKGIGLAELLAAIGLILPAATHYRRKEPQMIIVNAVIFALAVFVAWGRFGPYSF